jgi:hypothetical protein
MSVRPELAILMPKSARASHLVHSAPPSVWFTALDRPTSYGRLTARSGRGGRDGCLAPEAVIQGCGSEVQKQMFTFARLKAATRRLLKFGRSERPQVGSGHCFGQVKKRGQLTGRHGGLKELSNGQSGAGGNELSIRSRPTARRAIPSVDASYTQRLMMPNGIA